MTMITPRPGRIGSKIEWTVVLAGLWVGKKNGEFAGMIEARRDEGFSATTSLAKDLGMFATVDDAMASFPD